MRAQHPNGLVVAVMRQDFLVRTDEVNLVGSVWLPESSAVASVLTYPGSGATDRDNGSYFVPIRLHLIEHGCAVCSFDKRGVGESSGRWQEADIVDQARDLVAAARTVIGEGLVTGPLGLFGHSQGGWVVVEAASREPSFSFVVTSSGPGVSPAAQMRYSASCDMTAAGFQPTQINDTLRCFDTAVSLMRDGLSMNRALSHLERRIGPVPGLATVRRFLPSDPEEWQFVSSILDYDPRAAMRMIRAPLLAVFGGDDPVVPVDSSIAAFRESVPADRLQVKVFSGADHRIQLRDNGSFAAGYLDTLSAFVETARASA